MRPHRPEVSIRARARRSARPAGPPHVRAMMAALVLPVLLSSSPAGAEEARPVPGQHQHEGFYLRLLSGVGYTHIRAGEQDLTARGGSGTFGLALGYNVARNLIVYAELFDDIAVDPTVEQDGMEAATDDLNVGVIGWGAGAAYYFMPANAYASVTLAASRLTLDAGDRESVESDWGIGASLVGGKEWWVSDSWGLGVAAHVYFGGVPDGGQIVTAAAGALVLSATYD